MFTELHILKTYVDQLLTDQVAYHQNTIINQVAAECSRLQDFFFNTFNKTDNIKRLTEILNWYQNAIIKQADALVDLADNGHHVATQVLILIIGLTRHTQDQYSNFLVCTQALPVFEAKVFRKHVEDELIEIEAGLKRKHVSDALIKQVVKALIDLFKTTKYPALSYSEKKYIEIFLPQLKALASDEREKDWNMRLRQLLIKYNFNHMGIYKFLKAEGQNDANFLQHYGNQKTFLEEKENWIDSILLMPNLVFDPISTTLKKLLLKDLSVVGKKLMKKEDQNAHRRFDPNLGVGVLNLIFKYLFQLGLPRYNNKEDAAAAFCENIRSKEKDSISTHSIVKTGILDKENDARLLYKFLKRIMDELKKDFNI